ncbi:MAG: CHAP domain-containing protein [Gammaproteobacteria bacterium]|nr:CHAP domain-containing protein [Gammaproteobacteria bacterium]
MNIFHCDFQKNNKQLSFLKLLLLILIVLPSMLHAQENKAACYTQCITDYGDILGKTPRGISAYSNCNNNCVIFEASKYKGTYTGIKWQCVEFARRWLLINHGLVYGDVDYAIDIWDKINFFTHIKSKKQIPVSAHINGSLHVPVVGDLFIYAKALLGTGHVAVITHIDKKNQLIMLGEQNYMNTKWEGDSARTVSYIISKGHYWVHDAYLIGWKHANLTGTIN